MSLTVLAAFLGTAFVVLAPLCRARRRRTTPDPAE